MIVLLVLVWPLTIGFLVVRALAREWGLLPQVCLGAGLGMGVISCCFFLELETGIPSLAFELLMLAGAGFACWKIGWRGRDVAQTAATGEVGWWLSGTFAIVLAGAVWRFLRPEADGPNGTVDAWAIWNLHARFLVTPHWRDLFSESILWTHPDYPLLLSGFIARVWSVLGERDLVTPRFVGFLFTFGTVGLLGGTVAGLKGRTQGLLAALFLTATGSVIDQGALQCADVPIGFFMLATLAVLALQDRAWPQERGLSVLAGITAGMAAWTKNEGLLLVALVVVIRAIGMWRRQGPRAATQQTVCLALGLAPVLALVLFFKLTLATSNQHLGQRPASELLQLLTDPHRWQVMLTEVGKAFFQFGELPLGLPLFLAVYLFVTGVDRKNDRLIRVTGAATLFLLLAGYCVVCVISPFEIRWQTDTALRRLLVQLWPSTVFLAFLAARPIGETEVVAASGNAETRVTA